MSRATHINTDDHVRSDLTKCVEPDVSRSSVKSRQSTKYIAYIVTELNKAWGKQVDCVENGVRIDLGGANGLFAIDRSNFTIFDRSR